MPYTKEDIYSSYNRSHLYAKAFTEVEVLSDHGGVLIVKSEAGETFSILRNKLNDEQITGLPAEQKELAVGAGKAPAIRRQKRSQPGSGPGVDPLPGQGSLF